MILGFHYHIPAERIKGTIYTAGYLGVFIDSLSIYFDEIYLFMHSAKENEKYILDYKIKSSNVRLVDIGLHEHMIKRILYSEIYIKKIKKYIDTIDIMLIRGPSPLLPAITKLCLKNNTPFSYLLVGDYLEALESSSHMNKIKKTILYILYKYNKKYQDKYIVNEPIFVNSAMLYNEYNLKVKNCIQIKTTTLSKNDFYIKKSSFDKEFIDLLYTGRIDPTKGIVDIFEAVALLKKEEINNIRINLVGWETKKGFLKELKELSIKLNIKDNYIFHGKKTVGPELFDMYKKSDIYIIASKGNFEGFPRTLWEAMAHSVPAIATKVGSIPYFLSKDTTMLVEPNNIIQLKEAIKELLNNYSLRKTMIENSLELAKTNTMEKQSTIMIQKMKEYINER